ncbi:MAG: 3-deoxy-7-phosphoheptulonate synthase [Pseudomonadota bacterium]
MIVSLDPFIQQNSPALLAFLEALSACGGTASLYTPAAPIGGLEVHVHGISAPEVLQTLAETHFKRALLGITPYTSSLRFIGQHDGLPRPSFTYNGVTFSDEHCHLFAGLCAVDTPESVAAVMRTLQAHGQQCTRMGAYKPRTDPHSFQGHGADCLPYVFDLAGKFGIKVIAMEITHERQIEEIDRALDRQGRPTGVLLQIGTRNAQNFELLKAVGAQSHFPVLFKRGFGITLAESLSAAEYLAHSGCARIIFCLRGVKSLNAAPHRNLVDFAQIPVIKRLTRLLVCADPSHSVGTLAHGPDGIPDLFHATAQAVIAGAHALLVDVHDTPKTALVDPHQAISLDDLPWFLEDIACAREAYLKRQLLANRCAQKSHE